jgi:hypothetical protein
MSIAGDREGLIRAYDEEEAAGFGLNDLAEDTDEDDPRSPMIPTGFPRSNGHPPNGTHLGVKNATESIELQNRRSGER